MVRTLAFCLVAIAATSGSAGPSGEHRAVVATVQEFFDALAAKSEERLLAAVVPGGIISAQRVRDGKLVLRSQQWADWAKSVAASRETLEERMHRPEVRVKGTIASVWTYYTFYRNGALSHCGIDNFDLAKVNGRWKILNISYTVETESCRKK